MSSFVVITGAATVCAGSNTTLAAPAGFQTYTWSTGETTQMIQVSSAGSYSVITGNNFCNSDPSDAHAVSVTALPTAEITLSDDGVLTSSAGKSYRWFLNGQPVQGANERDLIPKQSGEYVVEVTFNGCVAVSETYPLVITALEEVTGTSRFLTHPNPTSRWLYITLPENADVTFLTVRFINSLGVQMKSRRLEPDVKGCIADLDGFPTGVYLVEVCVKKRCEVTKIILQ